MLLDYGDRQHPSCLHWTEFDINTHTLSLSLHVIPSFSSSLGLCVSLSSCLKLTLCLLLAYLSVMVQGSKVKYVTWPCQDLLGSSWLEIRLPCCWVPLIFWIQPPWTEPGLCWLCEYLYTYSLSAVELPYYSSLHSVYIDSTCMGVSLKLCMWMSSHDEVVYVKLCKQQLKGFPYMDHSPISLSPSLSSSVFVHFSVSDQTSWKGNYPLHFFGHSLWAASLSLVNCFLKYDKMPAHSFWAARISPLID